MANEDVNIEHDAVKRQCLQTWVAEIGTCLWHKSVRFDKHKMCTIYPQIFGHSVSRYERLRQAQQSATNL